MPIFTIPPIPQFTYKVYVEARERFERRTNKDFDISVPDNRSDLFTRWRIGAKMNYGKAWKGEVQFQYSEDAFWTKAKNASSENRDLGLAYVETTSKGWTFDLGRQKINIGQQRLIGSFEWNNVGRSFDGIRAKSRDWDVFAFRIGMASPLPGEARAVGFVHFNPSYGDTLYGFKHDRTAFGDVNIHTLDQSWVHRFGPVAFDSEGAVQFGRSLGKDQRAWAFHAKAAFAARQDLKPYVEFNAASGGSSATENRTFDNLYPTNHGKYGIADMTGWKNMNHIGVGVELAPRKNLTMKASWNSYSLRDSRDAWYGAAGTPNAHGGVPLKDPTGLSGSELGNELDLDAGYTITKTAAVSAGFSLFNPGKFVGNLTGHRDRQTWGYLQVSMRF